MATTGVTILAAGLSAMTKTMKEAAAAIANLGAVLGGLATIAKAPVPIIPPDPGGELIDSVPTYDAQPPKLILGNMITTAKIADFAITNAKFASPNILVGPWVHSGEIVLPKPPLPKPQSLFTAMPRPSPQSWPDPDAKRTISFVDETESR